jgi:two-component system chemotaxis sensor kinase CheA
MEEFSKEDMNQLLAVFQDQARTLLDDMAADILALEGKAADPEAMARLRRAAHTIKGDSACIGLENVTALAHGLEDVLDGFWAGELILGAAAVDLVLESIDEMRLAFGGSDVGDISETILSRLLGRISGLTAGPISEPISEPVSEPILGNAAASGPIEEVAEDFAGDFADGALREVPAQEGVAPDMALGSDFEALPVGGPKSKEPETRSTRDQKQGKRADYVRVEAGRIDALLNLAGEMVIARSAMNQVAADLQSGLAAQEAVSKFGRTSTQMGKLISELQKSVLKMRMVTIDYVFRRFNRPMRELAAEHGKQIDLEISGGETELDRTLVDLVYEPLLHLLRNAVDHGLELPEERLATGKPAAGKIRISAFHEGNQVVVQVADDGRGIDVAGLKARAAITGQVSAAQADEMSDEDALGLIFAPGLSTASEITLISGRGIGASAAKSVMEELRGTITVNSEPGLGATFTLRMPLTLAIIKALVFTVHNQAFALPLLVVSEVARVSPVDLIYADGFECIRLRGRFISIIRPGRIFGTDRRRGGKGATLRRASDEGFVIVVSVNGARYGIIADSIVGDQELVIKPLDSEWVMNDSLAGASLLGDGNVVLIMDAGAVFRKGIRYEYLRGV